MNLIKMVLILLCLSICNIFASQLPNDCLSEKNYKSGDICQFENRLFIAKHWVKGFDIANSAWFEIPVDTAMDWQIKTAYQFGDVVMFEKHYFVATQWNINNCPLNLITCPKGSTHYESWQSFTYGIPKNNDVKLSFKTVYDHDSAMPYAEIPILIDNVYVGTTNEKGLLNTTFKLSSGAKEVIIAYKGYAFKTAMEQGQHYDYIFELNESNLHYEDSQLIGFPQHLNDSQPLELYFEDSLGHQLRSQYLESVILSKPANYLLGTHDVTEYFSLKDNVIRINKTNEFYTKLKELDQGPLEICFTTSNDYHQFPSRCVSFF